MSGKSYAQLHQRLQDLINQGTKVADSATETPAAQIHQWSREAEACLLLVQGLIPTALAEFRLVRQSFEFKVHDDDEGSSSESAYRPEGADVLLDFRFGYLARANEILKLAATALEIEGHLLPEADLVPESSGAPGIPPDKKEGALVNSTQAQNSSKSVAFDAKVLRSARVALCLTQEQAAQWFGVHERQYKRWESGQQIGMHLPNYGRFQVFTTWAQQHTGLPPPYDTQMSPSPDTQKSS